MNLKELNCSKIYFLFEESQKTVEEFNRGQKDALLISGPGLAVSGKINPLRVLPLKTVLPRSYSEMDFTDKARFFLDQILDFYRSESHPSLTISGVSVIEPSTAPLVLYYLQKAFKYAAMASSFLDAIQAKQLVFSSLRSDLAKALYFEALEREIPVKVLRSGWLFKTQLKTVIYMGAWFFRETVYAFSSWLKKSRKFVQSDFLFICNVARQNESISPVIHKLLEKESGNICVISKVSFSSSIKIRDKRITYLDWTYLRNPRYLKKLLKYTYKIHHYWKTKIKPGFLTNFGKESGFKNTYLAEIFFKWFNDKAHSSIRVLLLAEQVIRKIKPKTIIVSDVSDFEAKSFTLIGREENIPSICIQYGMLGPHNSEWRYFSQDYVGAFDSESARIIKKHGIPENRIFLTGNPRFDSYRNNPSLREYIRKKLDVPLASKMITFMSVPFAPEGVGTIESHISQNEHEELLGEVYSVAGKHQNWFLVVKPHPEEPLRVHLKFQTSLNGRANYFRIAQGFIAYEMINASDVIITCHSTTGLETIYMNKPLITINLTGKPDYVDYASSGAACPVRSKHKLSSVIESYMNDATFCQRYESGRKAYIKRNSLFSKGQSSAAYCAQIINSLRLKKDKNKQT